MIVVNIDQHRGVFPVYGPNERFRLLHYFMGIGELIDKPMEFNAFAHIRSKVCQLRSTVRVATEIPYAHLVVRSR